LMSCFDFTFDGLRALFSSQDLFRRVGLPLPAFSLVPGSLTSVNLHLINLSKAADWTGPN